MRLALNRVSESEPFQVPARNREARIERKRAPELLRGRLSLPEERQRNAAITSQFGVIGPQSHRAIELLQRLVRPRERQQSQSFLLPRPRIAGLDRLRLLQ